MITICEFCGRHAARFPEPLRPICRNLADMAVMQQKGDEICRETLIARLSKWTVSESGLSMTRTVTG